MKCTRKTRHIIHITVRGEAAKEAAKKRHKHHRNHAMSAPRKMAFVLGDVTMTFAPDDIEAVWKEWEAAHPGKIARRDMTPEEFGDACMKRIRASARPTRTVLHN